MNKHELIKRLVSFYADRLEDSLVSEIIESQKIKDKAQAQHILDFCEKMFDLSMQLETQEDEDLGETTKVYDVEKAYSVLNDFVSEQGFSHLIAE